MSYSTLVPQEGIEAQFLIVLKPARRVTSWTLDTGAVYYNDFSLGTVVGVASDGVDFTDGGSSSLSASEFYYDFNAQRLYIRMPSDVDPNSNGFIVVTYEIYTSTLDAHFNRIPTDDTSELVYFDPVISKTPVISQDLTSVNFGFLPVQSTSISINNSEHFLEQHLFDSSFNNKDVEVYHWLGDLQTDNIKLVMRGNMSNVDYNETTVNIRIFDSFETFENELRPPGTDFLSVDDFPNIDPNKDNEPIRMIYGFVDDFQLVNISYLDDEPTTSDNREWYVRGDGSNTCELSRTVGTGSTVSRTELDDATGFIVGDSVWFDRAAGTDEYFRITAVDYDNNWIEHADLASPMTSGDTCKRGTVGYVDLYEGDTVYEAQYGRDWTESTVGAQDIIKITLDTNLETELSIPNTLLGAQRILARIYGKRNDVQLSASAFGSDSAKSDNLTLLPVILLDVLKANAGILEANINTASFTQLLVDNTDEIGFSSPKTDGGGSHAKIKDIIADLLKSGFAKLYLDDDLKWAVSQTLPISGTPEDIDFEEIIDGSFRYSFDYKDIDSDFVVEYRPTGDNSESKSVKSSSNVAAYLHGVSSTRTEKSLHLFSEGASLMANRMAFVFGDQSGKVTLNSKNKFFDNVLNDKINIKKIKLPGFAYDGETVNEKTMVLESISKGLRSVTMTLTDQKGIEDNSGEWS